MMRFYLLVKASESYQHIKKYDFPLKEKERGDTRRKEYKHKREILIMFAKGAREEEEEKNTITNAQFHLALAQPNLT